MALTSTKTTTNSQYLSMCQPKASHKHLHLASTSSNCCPSLKESPNGFPVLRGKRISSVGEQRFMT